MTRTRRTKREHKKHSLLFWVLFWLTSALLLFAWWLFLNRDDVALVKNMFFGGRGVAVAQQVAVDENGNAVVAEAQATASDDVRDNAPLSALMHYVMNKDGKERVFLVLLQNDMELRPGGGYIGSFAIVRMRDGDIVGAPEIHDLSNFDGRVPNGTPAPYPMREMLGVTDWKLRDSNWSPDFPTNAQQALAFYYAGGGQEQFDGVVAVTTDILSDVLEMTGPVTVEGFPGTYTAEGGVMQLEHQVEQGFLDQGIAVGDRKSIMPLLAQAILDEINFKNPIDLVKIMMVALHALEEKDVQVYFTDPQMQSQMTSAGWTGEMDTAWTHDYLMVVDANLGAWKTDAVMHRVAHYTIDLSQPQPTATLELTYNHTATQRDFMTGDYQAYTRVYIPQGAWVSGVSGARAAQEIQYGSEFGKKSVGFIIDVPLGTTKTVRVTYTLPEALGADYQLMLQKQAGMMYAPMIVDVRTGPEGGEENDTTRIYDASLTHDLIVQGA